jgi:uroporphyrinogen decarboxylase
MSANALVRFNAALKGQPTDRRCYLPMVFGYAATLAGINMKDYLLDAETMVQCQLQTQQKYQYDAVYVYGGNGVEVEAMGVSLVFPEADYPYVEPDYQPVTIEKLLKQPLPDPNKHGRMPRMLETAQKLQQQVGREVPVVGVVSGPFTIVAQLIGLEQMLFLMIDKPEQVQQLLVKAATLCRDFAVAQLNAGAQVIMLMDPASSQSIITPGLFRQYSLPLIKEFFKTCRASGALACWLTITGKTDGFFQYYGETGADLITLDYETSMEKALAELQLALTGNLRSFDFVDKCPEEIKAQCLELLRLAGTRSNYIIGVGCELPLNSKPENLAALMDVR